MALHGGERRVLFFNGVLVFISALAGDDFQWGTGFDGYLHGSLWPWCQVASDLDLQGGLEIHVTWRWEKDQKNWKSMEKLYPAADTPTLNGAWRSWSQLRVPSNLASVTWQTGTARRSCPCSFPLTNLCQTVEGFGRDVFLESEVMSKQIIGSFKQPRPFCWISFAEYPTQQTQVTSNHVNILCQCQHPAPLRCASMSLTTCSST